MTITQHRLPRPRRAASRIGIARGNERVEAHLRLAESIAWRFAAAGGDTEELRQVAYLGLVKASRRYDPGRGADFPAFAIPTITGELKRHVRDNGFLVRPPRRLQELRSRILRAQEELAQTLGRAPTAREIARSVHAPESAVRESLAATARPASLEDGAARAAVACTDLERVELHCVLTPMLHRLPRRVQRIIHLRFFMGFTQERIARAVGISQVHVSRLIAGALAELREGLEQ